MSRIIYKTIFKFKRGNAATWTKLNPILEDGEPGFELDTGKLKIGNNITPWNELPYLAGGSYDVDVDNKSITIKDDGTLSLYGFDAAEVGEVPSKGEDGRLHWIEPSGDEPIPESDIHDIIDN